MTSWLRILGATFVLGAGAVLLPVGPLGGPPGAAGVAYGAERTPPGAGESDRTRAVSRSPSASPSRSASPSASRQGSGPGEGRDRPGRDETAREESRDTAPPRRGRAEQEGRDPREAGRPDGDGVRRPDARRDASTPAEDGTGDDPAEQSPAGDSGGVTPTGPGDTAAAPAPATSSPAARPDTVAGTAVEPMLRILPLGSGLILIGLGFALAFLGLRMRQERGAR
ncbi:hypothetical protein ACWEPD_06805 [Streptomyces pseudogriseolus]